MKDDTLILLGLAGIAGYFLLKSGSLDNLLGGGGGGASSGYTVDPTIVNPLPPPSGKITPPNYINAGNGLVSVNDPRLSQKVIGTTLVGTRGGHPIVSTPLADKSTITFSLGGSGLKNQAQRITGYHERHGTPVSKKETEIMRVTGYVERHVAIPKVITNANTSKNPSYQSNTAQKPFYGRGR